MTYNLTSRQVFLLLQLIMAETDRLQWTSREYPQPHLLDEMGEIQAIFDPAIEQMPLLYDPNLDPKSPMYYNVNDDERRSIWLALSIYKGKMEKELNPDQFVNDRDILEKIDKLLERFSPKEVIK